MPEEKDESLQDLRRAIFEYDRESAARSAEQSLEHGIDPLVTLNVMTETIREVGEAFERGDLWLPDLVGASEAMQSAVPLIEDEIRRKGVERKSLGTVIAGTVFGDIHSIGKTMVTTLLTAAGFRVVDLGINVTAERFLEAVREQKADLLVMSALMTTTCAEQQKVIAALRKEGLREKVKVMVGGAAVTEEFKDSIGADGYDPTAPGAVGLAKRLVGKT
jgi:trimethylamine corrinoid protein